MVSPELFLDVTAVQERHSSGSPALLERVLKEARCERVVMLASVIHCQMHIVHYFLILVLTFPSVGHCVVTATFLILMF